MVGDLKLEPNESFVVNLSNPLFGVIADAQGQGTIVNDDGVPRMSIDDVRVVEGNAGTGERDLHGHALEPERRAGPGLLEHVERHGRRSGRLRDELGHGQLRSGHTSQTLIVLVAGDVAAGAERDVPRGPRGADAAPCSARAGASARSSTTTASHNPDVTAFTIVSDGATGATSGHNRLQWVNPVGGSPIEMRIRYNKGNRLHAPGPGAAERRVLRPDLARLPAGRRARLASTTTPASTSTPLIATRSGRSTPAPSLRRACPAIGRPFNATGRVKWKYATGTGTTGVAPPTVAVDGILAVDNSGDVHAMRRSATGGAVAGRAARVEPGRPRLAVAGPQPDRSR